ncbi:MAG: hybrid sensor histidine kinase/response regulator, partial [Bryobacteraceae bacterium]
IVFALDVQGRFTSINSAFERVSGFGREEALRMNFCDAVAPEDSGRARAMVKRELEGDEPGAEDFTLVTKEGRRRIVEVSALPLLVGGKPAAVHGIARDITDRRDLEDRLRQAQKMEAIGQLAGGVAHDFNNLLMVINGYSNMALEELAEDEPAWSDVEEVKKAGERATQLTRQLLAFSRKQVLQPQVLDLNETIGNVDKLLRRLLGENIVLRTECEPALGRVKADRGQLEQVLMNLAINARDAMQESGTVTLRTRNDGPFVVLEVCDTGCGMTPETKKHLFEPFFTTKAQGKGTGLGLSMVYGIVKQSAGEIEIDSEPERGTTFRIILPRTGSERDTHAMEAPVSPAKGSETILVAEDEDALRAFLVSVLRKLGYRTLEASNGVHALKVAAAWEQPIQLLVTDVVMPEMGGLELAERLAATRPDTRVLY